eukprot:CAMPEP_0178371046 /NCGR_PEP_ID=MMETSP0689_2-20121128/620_1 /TAXON_ID=160604 /ORGANISM="Amphidinium massartii, Strain CS-259" /LENGTH=71 /DNA_ID=CAMNT_0019990895 /DNA_START=389 /DNA_END=604 /DNA_ORIENTATION=+
MVVGRMGNCQMRVGNPEAPTTLPVCTCGQLHHAIAVAWFQLYGLYFHIAERILRNEERQSLGLATCTALEV